MAESKVYQIIDEKSELLKRVKDLEIVVASLLKEIDSLKLKATVPSYLNPAGALGAQTADLIQCYSCSCWYPRGQIHQCFANSVTVPYRNYGTAGLTDTYTKIQAGSTLSSATTGVGYGF